MYSLMSWQKSVFYPHVRSMQMKENDCFGVLGGVLQFLLIIHSRSLTLWHLTALVISDFKQQQLQTILWHLLKVITVQVSLLQQNILMSHIGSILPSYLRRVQWTKQSFVTFFIMPPNVGLGRSHYWSKQKKGCRVTVMLFTHMRDL